MSALLIIIILVNIACYNVAVVKAESVDPNNVSDILFPETVDVGQFGSAQSKLSRDFLIDLGAESKEIF